MRRTSFVARRLIAALLAVPLLASARGDAADPAPAWLAPTAITASPRGEFLYIACATAGQVLTLDVSTRTVVRRIAVPGAPQGLALSRDGTLLYVACAGPESVVSVIDPLAGSILASIPAGHTAMAPVLSADGRTLYVCNRFNHEVAFIDLATRTTTRRVRVPREPVAAAITPDGKLLLVSNHLPAGPATAAQVAACVSIIDTASGRVRADLPLPSGSVLVRGVTVSPDGRHAVVVHQLARFHLPTSQIERGWINTNAATLVDLEGLRLVNTVLLDNLDSGAANPWAAAWSADGRSFAVTHAGTHELSVVDFPALLAKLAQVSAGPAAAARIEYAGSARTAADVPNDLSFATGIRRRIKSAAADRGPRALALVGTRAYLANYFSDSITEIDLAAPAPAPVSIALQAGGAMSIARRGELLFNDATLCFQGWQSCASCHSADGRVDALNWDNLNDGIGNQKNTKSLLLAHLTPPSMWLGVRADAEVAVRAGIRNSLFTIQPDDVAVAIDEYLQSLDPIPSPHLVNGQLSAAAARGEKLFASAAVGCADCHAAPLFTDLRRHSVGTTGKYDAAGHAFDTPSLIEVWRTAPYLHDGSATSIQEVLTSRNRRDTHGRTSHLTPQEIRDLVEYVLSL